MKSVESVRVCLAKCTRPFQKCMLNVRDGGETSSRVPLRRQEQHSVFHIYAKNTVPALQDILNMHLKARASLFVCER